MSTAAATGGTGGLYNQSYNYYFSDGRMANGPAGTTYHYANAAHPHAVTSVGANTCGYDANGNMITRTVNSNTYLQSYDAENRLAGVTGAATASFVYDGDNNRVKGTVGSVTTVYVSNIYEVQGSAIKKYYYAGNQRIAMRDAGTLRWLLGDHLGSTTYIVGGTVESGETRYLPWGQNRYTSGTTPTSYKYTGQREEASLGLYYYGARWYDPALGRFIQPDTIVPNPGDAQSFDRYAYVNNNPLKYTDPSGHYGKDVHQGTTQIVGTIVIEQVNQFYGLAVDSEGLAKSMANSNQGTDDNPSTWPYNGQVQSFSGYGETQPVEMETVKYYHFMGQAEAERRLLYTASQGDVEGFGRALHLYQDTFSHIESGYTLPYGQAGIDDLRAMCRSCYGSDPVRNLYMDSLAANFFGHALPASKGAAAPAIWGAALSTDTFTGSARDIRMVNGTSFWITMYALLNAQKSQSEIDEYFFATYHMTAQEYYSQNVLENN